MESQCRGFWMRDMCNAALPLIKFDIMFLDASEVSECLVTVETAVREPIVVVTYEKDSITSITIVVMWKYGQGKGGCTS